MSVIDLDIRKWDGRSHYRHEARLLGRDGHGTWLGVDAGTPFTGPNGPGEMPGAFALVVREDTVWVGSFWRPRPGLDFEVYVDVTTTPHWLTETHLTLVDLDLDVIRRFDGSVFVDDEDEFEEHRVAFGYPDDLVETARATADWLVDAVGAHHEPFGNAWRPWLDRV